MLLDQKSKLAALALPANLRAEQLAQACEVIASAIRLTRGHEGRLMTKGRNAFGVVIESINPYPFVLTEEEETPDKPYIPVATNTTNPFLLWALQSSSNFKWLVDYAGELYKLTGAKFDANLKNAIEATSFAYPFKGLTPPPQPINRSCHKIDPFVGYQFALHYRPCKWEDGATKPAWFNEQLNLKLTEKKKKPAKQQEQQQSGTVTEPSN